MSGYRLMVVDDEQTTRQGLLALPMWQALGVLPVAQAEDGDIALAQLQAVAPDILLTDVKMPRMDGIALAREAKKLLPELKVLFVSGYDDVAYLRSALKMGACDYICKPIDLSELAECMRRIVGELEAARALRHRMQALTQQSQRNAPMRRQQLLRCLLDPAADDATLQEQQALVGIHLDDAHYTALCLELDNWQGALAALGGESLLEFAVQNIAEELLAEALPQVLVGVALSPSRYAALLGAPEPLPPQRMTALAALLRDTVEQCLHVSASVGIGPWVTALPDFSQAYAAAAHALLHRLHLGKNQVIPYNSPLITPIEGGAGGGGMTQGFGMRSWSRSSSRTTTRRCTPFCATGSHAGRRCAARTWPFIRHKPGIWSTTCTRCCARRSARMTSNCSPSRWSSRYAGWKRSRTWRRW